MKNLWIMALFIVGKALAFSSSSSAWLSSLSRATAQPAATSPTTSTNTAMSTTASSAVLYDSPVSNNGAKCRLIIYKKGLSPSDVSIVSPSALGGLKSEAYLKVNPQGKMPSLVCPDLGINLAESDTIARYLMSKYRDVEPTFQPDNPKSNLIARLHDMYLTTVQGAMYRAPGTFGIWGTRKEAIQEYVKQLNVIEELIDPNYDDNDDDGGGMYLCGAEVSLADAALFPSCVFANFMLPKFDMNPPLPPKMTKWFHNVKEKDASFTKVYNEIVPELEAWDKAGRWDSILGAGRRDTEPPTLFDKIVAGEIPAAIVKETKHVLAFRDINPAAPAHVLVIPKNRNGLTRLSKATEEHADILGKLMVVAAEIVRNQELGFGNGARIVVNDGPDGQQEVMHLHLHVLGGRQMTWPPG